MAKNNGGEESLDEFAFFDDWDFAAFEDEDSTLEDGLAGFDADELAGGEFDEDDEEFAELFSAFDQVVVTAEQQNNALNYVLAHEGSRLSKAAPAAHMRRPARKSAFRMRVGIVAACLALVIAGTASWMLPISSVEVSSDNYAVMLGMNVYGVAVTAQAEDELGQEVLDQTDVRNLGSDDARARLQETFERLYPELTTEPKEDTSSDNGATNTDSRIPSGSAGNASVTDPSGTPGNTADASVTEAPTAQQQGGQVAVEQPEGQLIMADPQNTESAQEVDGSSSSMQTNQSEQSAQQSYQMDQPNEGGQTAQQLQPGQQQAEPPQQNTQQAESQTKDGANASETHVSTATNEDASVSDSGEL